MKIIEKDMKSEKFRKQKEKYEKKTKRRLTDEEFERVLRKQRKIEMIIMSICLICGLAIAVEWPGRWIEPFGQFSSYLGWVIVAISAVSLIKDVLKSKVH